MRWFRSTQRLLLRTFFNGIRTILLISASCDLLGFSPSPFDKSLIILATACRKENHFPISLVRVTKIRKKDYLQISQSCDFDFNFNFLSFLYSVQWLNLRKGRYSIITSVVLKNKFLMLSFLVYETILTRGTMQLSIGVWFNLIGF